MRLFRRKRQGTEPTQEKPFIQPKLKVGQPGDKYEVEADKMADTVVNKTSAESANGIMSKEAPEEEIQKKPLASSISPLVQTSMFKDKEGGIQKQEEEEAVQSKEEEEPIQKQEEEDSIQSMEEEESVQTKSDNVNHINTHNVESKLKSRKGKGNQLPFTAKSEMERGFGADFSKINIHTDNEAEQMTKEMGAQAFTNGNDIYFNKNKFDPGSTEGKHLLAHELTHTIQQEGMVPRQLQFTIGDGNDLTSPRFSGNNDLEACLDNERTIKKGDNGGAVSLIQQALVDAGFPLPRFGVDGKFGNETRNALQNFQRSSSLNPDGVVGPRTISALDSLFTKGVPSLPPVAPINPPLTVPPAITTQTIKSAPDGTADSRKTIGVGERVRLSANTAGTWSVSEGHIIGLNNGANVIWEAPALASNPTITLTTPGGVKVIPFRVISPDAISMNVVRNEPIPVGTAGACMLLNVTINPLNVNFGRTQFKEIPGPGTNVSGYFTRFTAAQLFHHPNANFVRVNDNNTLLPNGDHAAAHVLPGPFSFGTWEWVIPNEYKVDGEPDANGRVFDHTVQAFTMFPGGTTIITKAGAFVLRTVNNFVI